MKICKQTAAHGVLGKHRVALGLCTEDRPELSFIRNYNSTGPDMPYIIVSVFCMRRHPEAES